MDTFAATTPASESTKSELTFNPVRAVPREHMHSKFPRTNVTKEMVLALAKEYGVQFVDFQFTDMHGVLKAITQPVHKLEDAIDNDVWFDGSSIAGFTSIIESDMILRPDLNTFTILPWTIDQADCTARLICDVMLPDGTPYMGCPRNILKRQLEEAKKLGLMFNVGPELEFHLFRTDEDGKPVLVPHDEGGYLDQVFDDALGVRRDMAFALDTMGMEIERMHHECGDGQNEINFRFGNALRSADNVASFKFTLKTVAKNLGLHVTFMPKPIFGAPGNGMHVNESLASITDGSNKFYDKDGVCGLSAMAQSFAAGQIQHIRALNAVMNPTVNSYKRLVIGHEAPVNAAWGPRNRTALIRIPRLSPAIAEKASRLEIRCPDPSCNPYLAFAVLLAAGLDGIKKGLKAQAPMDQNIWDLTPLEMKTMGIGTVAGNLKEALVALHEDEVLRDALGEETFQKFYAAKSAEWEEYRTNVSSWETDRYLDC